MMEAANKPDHVPIEAPERDESEELFDINNANVDKVEPRDKEESGKVPVEGSGSGGSGHTQTVCETGGVEEGDDNDNANSKTALVNVFPSREDEAPGTAVTVNSSSTITTASLNDPDEDVEGGDAEGDEEGTKVEEECEESTIVEGTFAVNNNLPPQQHLDPPYSARRGGPFSRKKKRAAVEDEVELLSSSEEEATDHQRSNGECEESYPQMKLRRKTLLKIEKLTDSDSRRSRDIMLSRGLSPPSSSDEENLHIGWVAYPAGSSKTRINKTKSQFRQRAMCTCVVALKYLVSPVTKVCKLCRNYKVHDVQSLQGSNGSINSENIFQSKKAN